MILVFSGWPLNDRINFWLAVATGALFGVTCFIAWIATRSARDTSELARRTKQLAEQTALQAKATSELVDLERANRELEWSPILYARSSADDGEVGDTTARTPEILITNVGRTPALEVNLVSIMYSTTEPVGDLTLHIAKWPVIGAGETKGPTPHIRQLPLPQHGKLRQELIAVLGDQMVPTVGLIAWRSPIGTRHLSRADGFSAIVVREDEIGQYEWCTALFE